MSTRIYTLSSKIVCHDNQALNGNVIQKVYFNGKKKTYDCDTDINILKV